MGLTWMLSTAPSGEQGSTLPIEARTRQVVAAKIEACQTLGAAENKLCVRGGEFWTFGI